MNLTQREQDLLLLMMKIENNWIHTFEDDYKNVLSTHNRKLLTKESRMNKANLSMYSSKMIEKGALVRNEQGGVQVNPVLMPEVVGDIVEYSFTLDMKED